MSRRRSGLQRVLVANRGEIAVRIVRACRAEGIETVLAVSSADRDTLATRLATRVVCIGPPPAAESYLRVGALVHTAVATGCDALHPGYGFLSEQPALARACEENGVVFVGPSAECLDLFGDKEASREAARRAGVSIPAGRSVRDLADAREAAGELGFPVLLKASRGGGGRGITIVRSVSELAEAFPIAAAEAEAAFGDGRLQLERFVERAKHVEVQVVADQHGAVIHLGERDCSVQLRYQKMVEEAPCALLPPELRAAMCDAAVRLIAASGYCGVATVEFLVDLDGGQYSFLEVNARIQVEHPVTEVVTGLDLVLIQLALAAGHGLPVREEDVRVDGHAIECRVNAQSPRLGLLPCPGRIEVWSPPELPGVRVDTHCFPGYVVPPFYDSLLAKVIVHGDDRDGAVDLMLRALDEFRIEGIDTNLPVLCSIVADAVFRAAGTTTQWLERDLLRELLGFR